MGWFSGKSTTNENSEYERQAQERKAAEMNRERIRMKVQAQKAERRMTQQEIKHRDGGVR